jgi:serine O-acetyltransferase
MDEPFETLLADLRAPLERDPAARSWLDVVLSYPGFHALVAHRLIHPLQVAGIPILPRFLANFARFLTGVDIHPAATIGKGVFIDHGTGVVIGETAQVGDGCTIYQGVTLGGTSLSHGKRHPTLGRNVTVGVNASVLGAIVLGDNAKVGGGSVVVKDVPANATVVGVPARIVAQDGKPVRVVSDRPQVEMPDPTSDAIARLQRRLEQLESRLAELEQGEATGDESWSWVI